MILDKNTKEKPKITYPTNWDFTIIGRDKDKVEAAIKEVFEDKEHTCTFSNTSKNGKFNSYKASCEVNSQEERDKLYKNFNEHSDIDYVI